jgi:uncharacterized SAM-binding protein YcdF (DUF218 family)
MVRGIARRVLLGLVAAAVVVAAAGPLNALAGDGKGKGRKEEVPKYGVIIALGVGHEREGVPMFRMVQRVGTAVQAFKAGTSRYILFTGGHTCGHIAESVEMKIMALAMGVPPRSILVEDGSQTTVENAQNAERIVNQKAFRSALLVTHASHLPRALKEFKKIKRLKNIGQDSADGYQDETMDLALEQDLPLPGDIQAVVLHGKSAPVDFRGETLVVDPGQVALAQTAVYLFQKGFSTMPYFIWHRAYGVGHVTRAEIIGIAAIGLGLNPDLVRYSKARRFAAENEQLFAACKAHGWLKVLAVVPRERAEEIELIEQQYAEAGISATVITAGTPRKGSGR